MEVPLPVRDAAAPRGANGAETLLRTLVAGGVDVCFANPGTSEMHFVAALDRVRAMRCLLGLFEGVVTGAADGYARMADRPACTLLHLGPGFANGMANLHNASKANSPIVNIVGDHATYHRIYNSPLTSDVEAIARPYSRWLKTSPESAQVSADAAAAIAAARRAPGGIATLVLPANTAWGESGDVAAVPPVEPPRIPADDAIEGAARLLERGAPAALLLGGATLRAGALDVAGQIAARTGARLYAPYGMARAERGAGRVPIRRVPFMLDAALAMFTELRVLILVGADAPVAFFAYPGRPSVLTPEGCEVHALSRADEDGPAALNALADRLGARDAPVPRAEREMLRAATGAIGLDGLAQTVGAAIRENTIVVDESQTSGRGMMHYSVGAPPHDYICNTGGSIGYGLPVAVGAAVACPGRRVLCLEADGSGMYTLQSLWTMAREALDVTTVIFANRKYQVLLGESSNVGAGGVESLGSRARAMLEIGAPDLDWVQLANGMGVPGQRVTRLEALAVALERSFDTPGPALIEVVV
ncbi:MAG: acetolactate synthase large subunit [Candidatus Velthaea sp.]